jgi:KaiC/GvpD/RAD55 family RecA-like ATPase
MTHIISDEARQAMTDVINTIGAQQMVLFLSSAGGGKTTGLINLSSKFMQKGMNGLFISFEEDAASVANRFTTSGDENFIAESMITVQVQNGSKICVKHLPLEEASTETIKQHAVDITTATGVKFDFIAVDSLDMIRPNVSYTSDTYTSATARIAKEMCAIGFELDCRILTAKTTSRNAPLGRTFSEIGAADVVMKIENTRDGVCSMHLLKCRSATPLRDNILLLDNQ